MCRYAPPAPSVPPSGPSSKSPPPATFNIPPNIPPDSLGDVPSHPPAGSKFPPGQVSNVCVCVCISLVIAINKHVYSHGCPAEESSYCEYLIGQRCV